MLWHDVKSPLVVIVGPTAVGKTALSIELAQRVGGEIISADSRLFYRGMDIGTAKPTLEERQGVPHHLIDVAEPDEVWSLAHFQREATRTINAILDRGKLPILVGGTGQYVWGLLEGWQPPDQEPHLGLRAVILEWAKEIGTLELYRKLAVIDHEAAAHIEPHNLRRTVRALEVIFTSGRKFSSQQVKRGSPYYVKIIGLIRPRKDVYARVDERIEKMIQDGLLEETQKLLNAGYNASLPTLSAIGYREMAAVIAGTMSIEEAVMLMKRGTRNFIRRQANWFNENDSRIRWFSMEDDTLGQVIHFINDTESWSKIINDAK